ncbi:MAG TPA: ECF transporter S component [Anaerolineales bacterium]|nr:ECF transporter S component [Anaerolineales bacterium]
MRRWYGLFVLGLAYAGGAYLVRYIPNPMVPGALLALNMVFPVLAGYFYGPLSGAVVGALGTALAALLRADLYDAVAILPHAVMGAAAGLAGDRRNDFLAALSVLVGHLLNLLFFLRLGLMSIPSTTLGVTLLGLTTEVTIDVVAIMLLIVVLKRWLYQEKGRW